MTGHEAEQSESTSMQETEKELSLEELKDKTVRALLNSIRDLAECGAGSQAKEMAIAYQIVTYNHSMPPEDEE